MASLRRSAMSCPCMGLLYRQFPIWKLESELSLSSFNGFKPHRDVQNLVHVLVHVQIGPQCQSVRHNARSRWRPGPFFCVDYANPCVDVRRAATIRDLDSKSVEGNFMGVQL